MEVLVDKISAIAAQSISAKKNIDKIPKTKAVNVKIVDTARPLLENE